MPVQYEDVPIEIAEQSPATTPGFWVFLAFLALMLLLLVAAVLWGTRSQRKAMASVDDSLTLTRRALELQERSVSMQERAMALEEQAAKDRTEIIRLLTHLDEPSGEVK